MKTSHIMLVACASVGIGCGSVSTDVSKTNEPTIDSLSPDSGGAPGGQTITVTGKHFQGTGMPIVVVGDNSATDVTVTSDTQLTFKLPPGAPGSVVDVTVATSSGFGSKAGSFSYNVEPVIIGISPEIGKGVGGTAVTISGVGFQNNNAGMPTLMIAGSAATNISVVNDTTVTATTAQASADTKPFTPTDVVLTNANGTATLAGGFKVSTHGLIAVEACCGQRIFHIDLASGAVTKLGTSDIRLHGCATSPSGQIFAISGRPGSGTNASNLLKLDPLTGAVTTVGGLNDSGNVSHGISGLTFDGTTLYGIDTETGFNLTTNGSVAATNRLASIDPTTGATTIIGSTAMTVNRSSSIAVKDAANVYVVTRSNASLDVAAVATSTLTTGLAFVGGTGSTVKGLVNVGGTLYLADRASPQSTIYSITVGANATLNRLAAVPMQVGGLCETPPTF